MSPDNDSLFQYLLGLGDDALVLGHRLSEWCSRAPLLEEDLALANIALDHLGQAQHLLGLAGAIEGAGRTADELAYLREAVEFRNLLLAELPTDDNFARVIAKHFLFDTYRLELFSALSSSAHDALAAFAAKAEKEVRYHRRHSAMWIVRLGDGTEESHMRMQAALAEYWAYTDELFKDEGPAVELAVQGICPLPSTLRPAWLSNVGAALREGTLEEPVASPRLLGSGRTGRHTEHLGHMLAEMQIVARSFPGAKW